MKPLLIYFLLNIANINGLLNIKYFATISDDKFSIIEDTVVKFKTTHLEMPIPIEFEMFPNIHYHINNSPFIFCNNNPNQDNKPTSIKPVHQLNPNKNSSPAFSKYKNVSTFNIHKYGNIKEIQFIQMKGYYKMIILLASKELLTCHIVIPLEHITGFLSKQSEFYKNIPFSFILNTPMDEYFPSPEVEVNIVFETTALKQYYLSMEGSYHYETFKLNSKIFIHKSLLILNIDIEGSEEDISVLNFLCKRLAQKCSHFVFEKETGYSRFNFHGDRGAILLSEERFQDGNKYYDIILNDLDCYMKILS
jgi:hypothetical protein